MAIRNNENLDEISVLTQRPIMDSSNEETKLKQVCVTQINNKQYYYPPTIPKQRGLRATMLSVIIILFLFLGDVVTNSNSRSTVLALYTIGFILSFGLQIIYRIILAFEESGHLTSRYDGKWKHLIRDTFEISIKVWITLMLSILYVVIYLSNNNLEDIGLEISRIIFCTIPSIYLLGKVLQLNSSSLADSLWMSKNNGLDYGSGMAYSFYHGYLNLVLPKTGTEEKNLKEIMEIYESLNNVKFSTYKLFILIPKSLTCFVSLKNKHSPSIDESESLAEKMRTVAGVQNRVYKNSVYKIINKNKKIYVSAEYATPLKTFKNVVGDAVCEHAAYYGKHKKEITLQFYLVLKNILEKSELSDFCELIYYEDQDSNGRYYDVGKIILARLKRLKKLHDD